MKSKIKLLLLTPLLIFILTGCDLFKNDVMEDIDVYTTTYPIKYIINYLYGEHSTIYSIYPNGVNLKEYTLSEKKINEFSKSQLFVFNSQDQDINYAVGMINKNPKLKLIDSALRLNNNYNYSVEELWLNPYNYLMMANNVKTSLNEYISDPYLNKQINKKYELLQYDLSKLDADYKDLFENADKKIIVTDKDLFKYLEKYNIEVISLEQDIQSITFKENDTLLDISKKYNVSASDILTYNNKLKETDIKVGQKLNIPVKTIDSSDLNKVKKLISEEKISYIYSDSDETNSVVDSLIKENELELIKINTMYSVDGGLSNTNESYLTIMHDNMELFKKGLY